MEKGKTQSPPTHKQQIIDWAAEHNLTGGIVGGAGTIYRLPCYDCHDDRCHYVFDMLKGPKRYCRKCKKTMVEFYTVLELESVYTE